MCDFTSTKKVKIIVKFDTKAHPTYIEGTRRYHSKIDRNYDVYR